MRRADGGDESKIIGEATSSERGGRVLGVDLGDVRIGIALSDSRRAIALPYEVVHRALDRDRGYARLAELVEELHVGLVVVGLPIGLDGRIGPAARKVLEEVDELRRILPVDITTFDERLSTVEASRMRDLSRDAVDATRRGGRGGHRGAIKVGRKTRHVRQPVDDSAAAVILNGFLSTSADR